MDISDESVGPKRSGISEVHVCPASLLYLPGQSHFTRDYFEHFYRCQLQLSDVSAKVKTRLVNDVQLGQENHSPRVNRNSTICRLESRLICRGHLESIMNINIPLHCTNLDLHKHSKSSPSLRVLNSTI